MQTGWASSLFASSSFVIACGQPIIGGGAPAFISAATGDSTYLIAQTVDMLNVPPATMLSALAYGYALYDLGIPTSFPAVAFAPDGSLQLATSVGDIAHIYSSDGSSTWHEEMLPGTCNDTSDLTIDDVGHRSLLCGGDQVTYFIEDDGGFLDRTHVADARFGSHILFDKDGRPLAACTGSMPSLIDLTTGGVLWTSQLEMYASAWGGDKVAIAVGSGNVYLDLFTTPALDTGERVWDAPAALRDFRSSIPSGIAIRENGEVVIAHLVPKGIGLTQKQGDVWTTKLLTTDGGRPMPRFDADGKLDVYYYTDGHLRRLREGSCDGP